MASQCDEIKAQKFFKRTFINEIDTYKDIFNLSLIDYDITDEDISHLIEINDKTIKLTSLEIRLSSWLSSQEILSKFLRKLFKKKQFVSFGFYINELNADLFPFFTDFLSKINSSVEELRIKIKYKSKDIERACMKKVLETLIATPNSLHSIDLSENRFDNEELMLLLNKLITIKPYEEITMNMIRIHNYDFNVDISQVANVSLINSNITSISYFPTTSLNLTMNNLSKISLKRIADHLSLSSTNMVKLNLSDNYIGDTGCAIIARGIAANKTLTTLGVASNVIIENGLFILAKALEKNQSIHSLDLKKNYINSKGIEKFCQVLENQASDRFTEIDLGSNLIDDDGLFSYAKFLSKHNKIKILSVTGKKTHNTTRHDIFGELKSLHNLSCIDLYSIDLLSNEMKDFNEVLMSNENIQRIILSNNKSIRFDGISFISNGLERNKNLTHLLLSQCYIGDEGCETIANSLYNNISIKELYLDYNHIGINGSRALGEKIIRKRSLHHLNLEHNDIDHYGAYFIGKYLEEAYGIKILNMNSNPIGNEGCTAIANGIKSNHTLQVINLSNTEMNNTGVKSLALGLIDKTNVISLNVSSNNITEIEEEFYQLFNWIPSIIVSANKLSPSALIRIFHGTEDNHLFKSLRLSGFNIPDEVFTFKTSNKFLKKIDLSYNTINISFLKSIFSLRNISNVNISNFNGLINDDAVGKICKYITESNSTIKTLFMQNNSFTSIGAEYIADMLRINESLVELNIADNKIGSKGMTAIMLALKEENSSLIKVHLSYCDINDYCARDIYSMLINNKGLMSLGLQNNRLSDEGVDTVLSSLRLNKTLKELSLGGNYTTDKVFDNVDKYLIGNKTLKSLSIKKANLSIKSMKKISKVLRENRQLMIVDLVNNHISYESICKVALSIEKNTNIDTMKFLLNGASQSQQYDLMSSNAHIFFN